MTWPCKLVKMPLDKWQWFISFPGVQDKRSYPGVQMNMDNNVVVYFLLQRGNWDHRGRGGGDPDWSARHRDGRLYSVKPISKMCLHILNNASSMFNNLQWSGARGPRWASWPWRPQRWRPSTTWVTRWSRASAKRRFRLGEVILHHHHHPHHHVARMHRPSAPYCSGSLRCFISYTFFFFVSQWCNNHRQGHRQDQQAGPEQSLRFAEHMNLSCMHTFWHTHWNVPTHSLWVL